jgi:hypothetical protein
MRSADYVPKPDTAFCRWSRHIIIYSAQNYERWRIAKPEEGMTARLDELEKKVFRCNEPTRSKIDTVAKNSARKEFEKEIRGFVQGLISRNPNVTDQDREMMSLPIRDTKPTPIGDPEGQAEADISYPARTQLMLHIRHVDGTPSDPRANYGCRIYYGLYAAGQPLPAVEEDLRESRFTRQKKELFTFRSGDSGKTACFCIRYENSRGKAGPWGPMMQALIP